MEKFNHINLNEQRGSGFENQHTVCSGETKRLNLPLDTGFKKLEAINPFDRIGLNFFHWPAIMLEFAVGIYRIVFWESNFYNVFNGEGSFLRQGKKKC